jgi:hypothetical protein
MSKIIGPTASVAVIAALLLLGIGASLPVDSARADNCVAAPNASPPQGQHWYYRSDRVSHRKCWYLHATMQLAHHVMAQPAAPPAEPAEAGPAPQPPTAPAESAKADTAPPPAANAPASTSPADSTQPEPHVTVLTVKTVSTPFVGTTPAPQQDAPVTVNTPPIPQTLPRQRNTADASVKPSDGAETTPLPPVPEAARHELAQTINAANTSSRTGPGEMFLLLALALGIAAIVIVIASKIAGRYHTPIISDDPDAAWIRYRAAHQRIDEEPPYEEQDVPFVDPQGEHGLADLHEQEWDDRPAETAAPSLKDIELALRILRQARQSRVA